MRGCIEEGILQGYLDGELSPEMMKSVAAHLAACAACADALREAESELAIFADAFASEASLTVPTERLRERIDAAIVGLQPSPKSSATSLSSRFQVWFAALTGLFTFTPRRAVAFASLIVVTLAVIFLLVQSQQPVQEIARNVESTPVVSPTKIVSSSENTNSTGEPSKATESPSPVAPQSNRMNVTPIRLNISAKTEHSRVRKPSTNRNLEQPKDVLLPGERSYLETIASLTNAIEARDEAELPPSLRAEYERNLAVVNHAIGTTRIAAHRNPKDADAAEFLFAAYQSKVELLSAVADQAYLSTSGR